MMILTMLTQRFSLILGLLASVFLLAYAHIVFAEAAPIGQVIWTKGALQAAQPNEAPRALQRRSPLYLHDVITTGKSGTGQIAFTDSSVVTLRNDTVFKIDEYNYQKEGSPSDDKSVMSLVKGGFRTITGAIPKANPEGYQMNTPVATIGVRGTDYSLFYSVQGLSIKLDRGKIYVRNNQGILDLDKSLDYIYAEVQGFHSVPKATPKASPVFSGQPAPTPVSVNVINTIAPVVNAPSSGAPGTPNGTNVTPTPSKTVSSFCVGLLQDFYKQTVGILFG